MLTKRCTGCHDELPLEAFTLDKRASDGRQSKCKACYRAYLAKKRADPEWNKKTLETLREKRFMREIKTTEAEKNARIKYVYGITAHEVEVMKEMQGHRCAICGANENDLPRGLVIDHDHELNKVRGMLCHECNKAIGIMHDDYDRLMKAAEYVGCYKRYLLEVG